jgi:hypothetical protein
LIRTAYKNETTQLSANNFKKLSANNFSDVL